MRAVIIDDERAAIGMLEEILKEYHSDIKIAGTVSDARMAPEMIISLKPDIVFLDVNMPGLDGFQVLQQTGSRNFEVVFVTAYDKYALQAFKENAANYILKPVNIDDVTESIRRIKEKKQPGSDNTYKRILDSLYGISDRKIGFATSDGVVLISRADIIYIEADQSYSEIYMPGGKKLLVSKNIGEVERMIDDPSFFRAHKSILVNLKHIVRYSMRDGGEIELATGAKILLARRKKEEFVEAICRYHGTEM